MDTSVVPTVTVPTVMVPTFANAGIGGVQDGYYMRPSRNATKVYFDNKYHIDSRLLYVLENTTFDDVLPNDTQYEKKFFQKPELFTTDAFSQIFFSQDDNGNPLTGTPAAELFCLFDGSFTLYTQGIGMDSWIFLHVVEDKVYAILILTYTSGTGYYIDYFCRNNAIIQSKGAGLNLFKMVDSALLKMLKPGEFVIAYLVDATLNDYYDRFGYAKDKSGYSFKTVRGSRNQLKRAITWANTTVDVSFPPSSGQIVLHIVTNNSDYKNQIIKLNECLEKDYEGATDFQKSVEYIRNSIGKRLKPLIIEALNKKLIEKNVSGIIPGIFNRQKEEIHELLAMYNYAEAEAERRATAKGITKRRRKPKGKKTLAKRRPQQSKKLRRKKA